VRAEAYSVDEPKQPPSKRSLELADPGPDEALVAVEACGLCHTDLAYADGSVAPRHPYPLVLGHEIAGQVTAAGEHFRELVGHPVLVPAVLPCGHCPFCSAGRGNACLDQKMPGNDIHGGFASHVLVPAGPLIPLDDRPPSVPLDELSVVADAVATAYQALRRGGVESDEAVFVVGAGGVGGFLIQIARALGARVAACDVSPERLATAASCGAEHGVDVGDREPRAVRAELEAVAADWGIPPFRRKIFECSGTPAGQTLAYGLLGRGSTLVQVGYSIEKISLRLSNLMAFDATLHGTWGCPPERFPEVLQLIYDGQVVLGPFVEHAPMSQLAKLLDDMAHHRLQRRMILHPDG
jgi:6-hydroxycyclohex-1-ene-1-carbonyl-CoA dehydrogenase